MGCTRGSASQPRNPKLRETESRKRLKENLPKCCPRTRHCLDGGRHDAICPLLYLSLEAVNPMNILEGDLNVSTSAGKTCSRGADG